MDMGVRSTRHPGSAPITSIVFLLLLTIVLGLLGILSFLLELNFPLLLVVSTLAIVFFCVLAWKVPLRTAIYFFLLPTIALAPHLTSSIVARIYVYQLFLLLFFPLILLWRPKAIFSIDVWLMLFGTAIVVSMGAGAALGTPPVLRDGLELAKPVIWWLIFSLALSAQWTSALKMRALWIFMAIGVVMGILALFQSQNWGDINQWLTPLYMSIEERLARLAYRATGTFSSPNRLGLFAVMELSIAFTFLLFAPLKRWHRIGLLVFIGGMLAVILLTGSRFALLTATTSLGVLVFLRIWYSRSKQPTRAVLINLLLLVAVTVGISLLISANLIATQMTEVEAMRGDSPLFRTLYRLSRIGNEFDVSSARVSDWLLAIQLGMQSPILGSGPSTSVDRYSYFHHEYLGIFRWYGLFGLSVFLTLYGLIARRAYLTMRSAVVHKDQPQMVIGISVLISLLIVGVNGLVTNPLMDFHISAMLWWLFGIMYGRSQRLQNLAINNNLIG